MKSSSPQRHREHREEVIFLICPRDSGTNQNPQPRKASQGYILLLPNEMLCTANTYKWSTRNYNLGHTARRAVAFCPIGFSRSGKKPTHALWPLCLCGETIVKIPEQREPRTVRARRARGDHIAFLFTSKALQRRRTDFV